MGSKGGGGGDQTVTQRTEVPAFLQPFVENQGRIGSDALTRLEGMLSSAGAGDLVAGFSPEQEEAFALLGDRARGGGGFLPTAEQTFLSTAQGVDPRSYIDPAAYGALESTAAGNFLYGGEGFNAAVDAAVRAAQPGILSAFGGAGGAPGGLARAAIGQAATDAFAGQYSTERQRQLQASGVLADLAGSERANQLGAAGALPGIATAGAGILERLGLTQQNQAQRELTAPMSAQEALLSAAGGGVPLASLLGQTQSSSTAAGESSLLGNIFGGAASGAGIGGKIGGPWGAAIGGIGGGALGAFS